MTANTTPAAPGARDDAGQAEFEAEFHDGPPAMGVVLLVGAFLLGMYVATLLWWLR